MIKFRILIVLVFFSGSLKAQSFYEPVESFPAFIGLETGIVTMATRLGDIDFIRGGVTNNPYYYTEPYIKVTSTITYFGIRPEWFFRENRLSLSGGLRYTVCENEIGKEDFNEFFYWKFGETGINTEYLRVVNAIQHWKYLSIPVEAKFFLFEPGLVRGYIKFGTELGIRVATETDITFLQEGMELYEEELATMLSKPHKVRTVIYSAFGLRIGRANTPSLNFEMMMPYYIISRERSATIDPLIGVGFQIGIQCPIRYINNHE